MSVTTTQEAVSPPTAESPRIRLDYLDGLRGLAALYVVFHHASHKLELWGILAGQSAILSKITRLFSFGHYSVDVFIVLSGYCLMLPVARSASGQLPGGLWDYLKRRGRRILPPYYAALALALLVNMLAAALEPTREAPSQASLAHFTPGDLFSHLLLIHNLDPRWAITIDPPMWSVATEWQIYFLFPALLLPVWRRAGLAMAVLAAFVVGLTPHLLWGRQVSEMCPWFLGLFALGMAGAVVGFAPSARPALLAARVPWGAVSAALWLGIAAGGLLLAGWYRAHMWVVDPLVGLATACTLIYCTGSLIDGRPNHPLVLRFLNTRSMVALGAFSYSLYLVHYPLLGLAKPLLLGAPFPASVRFALMFAVVVPVVTGAAYLFHLAFERRFMSHRR